jgi:hypothetical protein
MRLGARRIRGRGPIKVVVSNKNSFRVSGKLSAKAARGVSRSRAFVVGAKAGKTVSLKLSKPLKRSLKRKRKLSLRLVMKVRDQAGNSRTVRKRVSLRLRTG